MARAAVWVERGVGETRAAYLEADRVIEIAHRRWDEGALCVGTVIEARLASLAPAMGGAFVALPAGPDGFLPLKPEHGLGEGARVVVRIAAEAHAEKGPRLKRADDAEPGPAPPVETALARRCGAERIVEIAVASAESRALDVAVERALSPSLALPQGGRLWIEPTRALTAIDVDGGGRLGGRPARSANLAAVTLIAAQLRLRGIGGLVVVDFISQGLKSRAAQDELAAAAKAAFAADPSPVRFAPLSRFGVLELTRERLGPSLAERLAPEGALSTESLALDALRGLEREGRANPGSRLRLDAHHAVIDWLERAPFDWRGALTDRLGARFDIAAEPSYPKGQVLVSADR
ncbi:MAG: ribonuclease E/G [Maricaulaceae bacterium]